MDSFHEQLVVRKNNSKHIAKLVIYLMLIFAVPAIFMVLGIYDIGTRYFVIVAICAFFFAVYGSYYLMTGMYTEYEYAVTNSNITIDKITAKRSRKRIISVDIKKFNTLRRLADADVQGKSYRKFFRASVTESGEDVYAAEMHLDKFNGDCLLLFSPDEATLDAMKPYLRTNVKAELFKAGAFGKGKSAKAAKAEAAEKKEAPAKIEKKTDLKKEETPKPEKAADLKKEETPTPTENKTASSQKPSNGGSTKKKKKR